MRRKLAGSPISVLERCDVTGEAPLIESTSGMGSIGTLGRRTAILSTTTGAARTPGVEEGTSGKYGLLERRIIRCTTILRRGAESRG
jgi:hypothetical protein